MRILVAEDVALMAERLCAELRQRGHTVDACTDSASAWTALCASPFDLLLLALALPGGGGAALVQRLRQAQPEALAGAPGLPDPAMVVVAMADAEAAVPEGCDHLVLPLDPALLDTALHAVQLQLVSRGSPVLRHGDIVVDPVARTVLRDGQAVELSPREFSVLLLLLEARGAVLSRLQLESRLYSWQASVGSNAVEVHIHHLRKKLGSALIRTRRGVGYFVAWPQQA